MLFVGSTAIFQHVCVVPSQLSLRTLVLINTLAGPLIQDRFLFVFARVVHDRASTLRHILVCVAATRMCVESHWWR